VRVGSEESRGMETGEDGAQNSLERWKQVRVGSDQSGGIETGVGGLRTVFRDSNR
jgi:hypothetical protein